MKARIEVLCIAIVVAGCMSNKKEQAESLLRDPVMQDELFSAIIRDSSSLNQFFKKFHQQNGRPGIHAMHGRMMKRMYSSSNMDSIMMVDSIARARMLKHMLVRTDRDSMFCMQMSDSIMRHGRLSRMMHQKTSPPGKKR